MNKVTRALIAASAMTVGSLAQATVVIDDFSVGQSLTLTGPGTVGSVVGGAGDCAVIIGCTRDIVIENLVSASNQTTTAIVGFNNATPVLGFGNELSTNVPSTTEARFTLTYDGDNASGNFGSFGLGNYKDFTGLAGIQFLVFSDGGLNDSGTVRITIKDATNKQSVLNFPAVSTGLFPNVEGYTLAQFSFASEFVTDAGFDWTKVAGLQAIVNVVGNEKSLDFALRTVTAEIPEPGSLALMGLALLGVGVARRRVNKA